MATGGYTAHVAGQRARHERLMPAKSDRLYAERMVIQRPISGSIAITKWAGLPSPFVPPANCAEVGGYPARRCTQAHTARAA
jgi:hypothetical protein